MITNANDIRGVRPVANNISDFTRIDTYIEESETLHIMPVLTPVVYKSIEAAGRVMTSNVIVKDYLGRNKVLTASEYNAILFAGYYDNNLKYTPGLIEATAYIAYARMLKNQALNVTAFGVKVKTTNFSADVDEATLFRSANEAHKIGMAYLIQVVEYVTALGLLPACNTNRVNTTKFKVIGD